MYINLAVFKVHKLTHCKILVFEHFTMKVIIRNKIFSLYPLPCDKRVINPNRGTSKSIIYHECVKSKQGLRIKKVPLSVSIKLAK